jgi:hypothetical protein
MQDHLTKRARAMIDILDQSEVLLDDAAACRRELTIWANNREAGLPNFTFNAPGEILGHYGITMPECHIQAHMVMAAQA